jgi:hypothetical protein
VEAGDLNSLRVEAESKKTPVRETQSPAQIVDVAVEHVAATTAAVNVDESMTGTVVAHRGRPVMSGFRCFHVRAAWLCETVASFSQLSLTHRL